MTLAQIRLLIAEGDSPSVPAQAEGTVADLLAFSTGTFGNG